LLRLCGRFHFRKCTPPRNMTGQPANNGWLYPAGAGAAGSGAGSGAGSEGLGSGGAGAGGFGAKAPPTQAQLQMVRWCRRGKVDDALFVVGWQGPLETREGQARGGSVRGARGAARRCCEPACSRATANSRHPLLTPSAPVVLSLSPPLPPPHLSPSPLPPPLFSFSSLCPTSEYGSLNQHDRSTTW